MEPKLKNAPKNYRSKVWEHFGFRPDVENNDKSTCKLCYTDVSCKAGTTSNMKTHLKRLHNIEANEETKPTPAQHETQIKGQIKLSDCVNNKLSFSNTRHVRITKAVGGFLSSDLRPYSTVSCEGFRHLLSVLEPRYQIPSRTYFTDTVIPGIYETVMKRVKMRLSQATYVAITTDAWTSRATENYITITGHFVNEKWEIENYTLQTKKFSDSHTGVNLANDLKETVDSWKLERGGKGPAVTTDNAANIVCGVREAGLSPHVGCFAHTINLATQKGLKVAEMDRLLGRVRRIVAFFHKSAISTTQLKIMQVKLDIPQHKLIIDVQTRWNSSYDMLDRYLEQQAAVFAALMSKEVKKQVRDIVTLSDEDVKNIEDVVKVLKPLKTVTTLMCSEQHPTVSLIHPLKQMLIRQLVELPSDSHLVSALKIAIKKDLNARYTDPKTIEFLLRCAALDPRFKSLPYSTEMERVEVFHSITQKPLEMKLMNPQVDIPVRIKTEPTDTDPSTDSSSQGVDKDQAHVPELPVLAFGSDAEDDSIPEKKLKPNETDVSPSGQTQSVLGELFGDVFITSVVPAPSLNEQIQTELQNYKEEKSPPLESNPLAWWRGMEGKYPILSKLAKQALGIPATSVASERVFSTAGDVVTAQRACLTSEQVDMLIFTKRNISIPEDLV